MLTVKRCDLLACSTGEVEMLSYQRGNGFAVEIDLNRCQQAEDAMNRGETVLLTVDGRAVSEMRVVDGEYMETRREPAGVGSPIL